jgi:hypothetical protein
LVSRLLGYAIGRRLELSDQPVVHELTTEFAANRYRMRDLIQRIVASELFQTK